MEKNPSWTWEIIAFSISLVLLTHIDVGPTHGLTTYVSREDQTPKGYKSLIGYQREKTKGVIMKGFRPLSIWNGFIYYSDYIL